MLNLVINVNLFIINKLLKRNEGTIILFFFEIEIAKKLWAFPSVYLGLRYRR